MARDKGRVRCESDGVDHRALQVIELPLFLQNLQHDRFKPVDGETRASLWRRERWCNFGDYWQGKQAKHEVSSVHGQSLA